MMWVQLQKINVLEITTLDCGSFVSFTDKDMCELTEKYPKVTGLVFPLNGTLTDTSLAAVCASLRNLNSININGCSFVTFDGLMKLAKAYPNLYSLGIANCCDLSDSDIATAVRADCLFVL